MSENEARSRGLVVKAEDSQLRGRWFKPRRQKTMLVVSPSITILPPLNDMLSQSMGPGGKQKQMLSIQ